MCYKRNVDCRKFVVGLRVICMVNEYMLSIINQVTHIGSLINVFQQNSNDDNRIRPIATKI